MAVNMDECKHGLPQFICRRGCKGNERSEPGSTFESSRGGEH